MGRKGREGIAKRARERARQERKEAKQQRRFAPSDESDPVENPDEAALMEEFRVLSERHAAGHVSDDLYTDERHRIFVELGIESDD